MPFIGVNWRTGPAAWASLQAQRGLVPVMLDAPRGGQRGLQSPETTWPLPGPRRLPGPPDSHRRLPPGGDPRSHRARASSSPRPAPRLLPARCGRGQCAIPAAGGVQPSRSSDEGTGELRRLQASRRISATSGRSSFTARPSLAITGSRAAHPRAAGGGNSLTGHHQDNLSLINSARWGQLEKDRPARH